MGIRRARWSVPPQVREKEARSPPERNLERRERMAIARGSVLAVRRGRTTGEDWRDMLEEELAKKKTRRELNRI